MDSLRLKYEKELGKNEDFFENKFYEKQKETYEADIRRLIEREKVKTGLVTCNKCKSKSNTFSEVIQKGSGDEGMTWINQCRSCNISWKS